MTPAIPAAYTVFLPFVMVTNYAPFPFGIQADMPFYDTVPYFIPNRVYQSPWRWSGPEPWFYDNVKIFGSNPFIAGAKLSPLEYRLWAQTNCSPPKPEYYGQYANDVAAMVRDVHPWGVEIWNEPNVKRNETAEDYYGCFVDNDETWYHGRIALRRIREFGLR